MTSDQSEFLIELVNPPNGVYFPGMMVTGTVVCNTAEPKDYKQIVIKLNGGARVHWTESEGTGDDRRTRSYSSHEQYISCMAVLWDKTVNSQDRNLPAGNNRFNFSLQLAGPNLPPSYTGTSGAITYTLEARIIKGMFQQDTTAVTTLNVKNVVAISDPEFAVPFSVEVRKTLCCLCCESGPIVMSARIPRRGYCIGYDSIPVEVTIDNGSSRNIDHILVSLQKRVVYTAERRHHPYNHALQTFGTRAVAPHETAVLHPDPIPIPSNVTPTLRNCGILSVNYYVHVSVTITYGINPFVNLPIVIGNVPLEGGNTLPSGAPSTNPAGNYPPPPPTWGPPPANLDGSYPPPPTGGGWKPPPTDVKGNYPPSAPGVGWDPPPAYTSEPLNEPPPIGFVDPIKNDKN